MLWRDLPNSVPPQLIPRPLNSACEPHGKYPRALRSFPILQQDSNFPDANGGKVAFIAGVVERLMDKGTQLVWFAEHPQPDVRVEQVAHHFFFVGIARRFPVRNVGL